MLRTLEQEEKGVITLLDSTDNKFSLPPVLFGGAGDRGDSQNDSLIGSSTESPSSTPTSKRRRKGRGIRKRIGRKQKKFKIKVSSGIRGKTNDEIALMDTDEHHDHNISTCPPVNDQEMSTLPPPPPSGQ